MQIETLVLGELNTNCYLVSQAGSDSLVVIDPAAEPERLKDAIGDRKVAAILLTHGHFDHTGALKAFPDIPIYMHPADRIMLTDPVWSVGEQFQDTEIRPDATDFVQEGDHISAAGLDFEVLHVPGHTLGSVAYKAEKTLFTGDTLFCRGYGRVDHPGGDFKALFASLKRLLRLDEDCAVYPGHGRATGLWQERGRA